eukprot:tig00021348_g20528.t1
MEEGEERQQGGEDEFGNVPMQSFELLPYPVEIPGDEEPERLFFNEERHEIGGTSLMFGEDPCVLDWRMKERMKTVSVALVLCLNIGVDPPDVVKTTPCARLECWMDPTQQPPQKALEAIGKQLQTHYERWQPRARYKQCLDPTLDAVKKLCVSLRRNAKDERVLFHYNGHGVPRPTPHGEIWVFNNNFTQYIPLSIYDLQTWMGTPSIYVFDCSSAGMIVNAFQVFQEQREKEIKRLLATNPAAAPQQSAAQRDTILMAACGANELLPMNPEYPADIFTVCLTTPIKIALRWYCLRSPLLSSMTLEAIDKIPGKLNDRKTPLGELNWIFTAITDTIAWNALPRGTFQKLFRQDLLVASLFRNFLLAERVLRSLNCTPVTCPKLPPTHQHPMWQAWDLAAELCLSQLPKLLADPNAEYQHSPFFEEQLTAFEVWLEFGSEEKRPPEQLPIVLQVLLSQVHRLRALLLLGRFLDVGPWAVDLALSVGIFPYVLKLLQSPAPELRQILVFIWAKVMALDRSCQCDLLKDNGPLYFVSFLAQQSYPAEKRAMAAFVLAAIANNFRPGQSSLLSNNLLPVLLAQASDPDPLLRRWVALCMAKMWQGFEEAKWTAVRDAAPEKLLALLADPVPEVRAAAAFACGCLFGGGEGNERRFLTELSIGAALAEVLKEDGCASVRREALLALSAMAQCHRERFRLASTALAAALEEEARAAAAPPRPAAYSFSGEPHGSGHAGHAAAAAAPAPVPVPAVKPSVSNPDLAGPPDSPGPPRRARCRARSRRGRTPTAGRRPSASAAAASSSSSSAAGASSTAEAHAQTYNGLWRGIVGACRDPLPEVAVTACLVVRRLLAAGQDGSAPPLVPRFLSALNTIPKVSSFTGPLHAAAAGAPPPVPPPTNNGLSPRRPFPTSIKKSASAADFHGAPGSGSLGGPSPGLPPHMQSISRQPRNNSLTNLAAVAAQNAAAAARPPAPPARPGPSGAAADPAAAGANGAAAGRPAPARRATTLYEWSAARWGRPLLQPKEQEDGTSPWYLERRWRHKRNEALRAQFHAAHKEATSRKLDSHTTTLDNGSSMTTQLLFHPYDPYLVVADDSEGLSVWNYDEGAKANSFSNGNGPHTRITALQLVNDCHHSLVVAGSDDGVVRVWGKVARPGEERLVAAWRALTPTAPRRVGGLVLCWQPANALMLAAGDAEVMRVWDVEREQCVAEVPVHTDSSVTAMAHDESGSPGVTVAGCGDGSLRVFDARVPSHLAMRCALRDHGESKIVGVHIQRGGEHAVLSGSAAGDVKFWDVRAGASAAYRTMRLHQKAMTAFVVHDYAPMLAGGSQNQFVKIMSFAGETLSMIRFHEGFLGQRIGPVSSLAFHPHRLTLASGSTDSVVSIYSSSR